MTGSYAVLCGRCFGLAFEGVGVEELTVGVLSSNCEICGTRVGRADFTGLDVDVGVHTPRRAAFARALEDLHKSGAFDGSPPAP